MRLIKTASGTKPGRRGNFVVFPSTRGSVKLSMDVCAAFGIGEGDKLLFQAFAEVQGFPADAILYTFTKDNASEVASKVGKGNGAFVNCSSATAWEDCRTTGFAGRDLLNTVRGEDGKIVAAGEKVEYKVSKIEVDGVSYGVLHSPTITKSTLRKGANDESEEEEEDENETTQGTTEEVVQEVVNSVEEEVQEID